LSARLNIAGHCSDVTAAAAATAIKVDSVTSATVTVIYLRVCGDVKNG